MLWTGLSLPGRLKLRCPQRGGHIFGRKIWTWFFDVEMCNVVFINVFMLVSVYTFIALTVIYVYTYLYWFNCDLTNFKLYRCILKSYMNICIQFSFIIVYVQLFLILVIYIHTNQELDQEVTSTLQSSWAVSRDTAVIFLGALQRTLMDPFHDSEGNLSKLWVKYPTHFLKRT